MIKIIKYAFFISIFSIFILSIGNAEKRGPNHPVNHLFAAIDTARHKKGTAGIPKKLLGMWADSAGGNIIFVIDQKTFFYPDQSASFRYKIKGNTIIIHYDGFTEGFVYKFKGNDILEMSDDGRTDLFYRKK